MSVVSEAHKQHQELFNNAVQKATFNAETISKIKWLEEKFEKIIEKDKKKEQPVLMWVAPNFIEQMAIKIADIDIQNIAIGVTGESAAGKSTFVKCVSDEIENYQRTAGKNIFTMISADNYFNDISDKINVLGSFEAVLDSGYDTDAPTSFQLPLMKKDIEILLNGEDVMIPEYTINGTGVSIPSAIHKKSGNVIMAEGIAVLYPGIKDVFDIRVYVDIDETERKERFIKRAIKYRCLDHEGALKQWKAVNESAEKYLRPTKEFAQIIINGKSTREDITEFAKQIFELVISSKNVAVLA